MSSTTKTLTIPFNYQPRPYQLEYLKTDKRFSILVFHRRAGKSLTALNEQIRKAFTTKGIYYYILPTYRMAKTVAWDSMVKEHVPNELVEKKNDSELAIYYKNGSIQRFVGCEDPDKHRGINPIDVVFDEYSEMSEQMWTAIIQPILRENRGTATFVFTPKGKNHSWKLLEMAKTDPEWFISIKGVSDTGIFSDEELNSIKANTPQALYEQEYEAKFLEGASQFFKRIHQCTYDKDMLLTEEGEFQLGVDLAKYNDWTVLTPFNLTHFIVYQQERFNQIDYNLQKAKIEAMARRFNNALIWPDSTGVGDPIVEDLKARGLSIGNDGEGFKFTETSRMNLLNNLAILMEQGKIKIPNDEGLISELESFQYSLGESGKIRVRAPEGLHDDRVMSLALSVWGATEPVRPDLFTLGRVISNRNKNVSYT